MRVLILSVCLGVLLASCSAPPQTIPRGTAVQSAVPSASAARFEVLVFSKTGGFRHSSIEDGIVALQKMGDEHDFGVTATEDAARFTYAELIRYDAVIFLSTTGDILDETQQAAFERYIKQGGGFVGIHAAADTEYDWAWYGGLVGAYFKSHPDRQNADVLFTDRHHPSTAGLPFRWNHYDEWYDYQANPRADVHVLAVVDEGSYENGAMGHDHPIAWAHEYDGGRAWYTGLGHTSESFSEDLFLSHVLGGIEWAVGHQDADVSATLASGFEEVVLTGELTDPMEIDITNDGRVFIVEWAGAIKIWEPATNAMRVVGWLPVEKNIEDGLLGLALDPGFDDNGWMYIYYSPVTASDSKFNRLSRFTYDGAMLDMDSEIAVLEIPVQRVQCCHSGGAVQFDANGLLYFSTGDNSGGDRDHEDDDRRRIADQARTAGNTNDLRGKILRIRPQPDGSYTIPEGNLFEADEEHRGEIYTMGHRNPFRFSIDNKTGWIYWGDVGPGTNGGWDEFNQARGPGFFGWPLFTGYNEPFAGYHFHGAEDMAPYQNAAAPINGSPFNTGARELPPAQSALIPYFYGTSEEFPELGAGGLNPMGGPIFHFDASTAHPNALPAYYDDKVMIYEWMRNWVQIMTLDEGGKILKIDPFLPGLDYISPMDIEVGPQGRLYILEWGDEFWGSNANAQLVRLDYYGSEVHQPREIQTASVGGPIRLNWPPAGGFFDFEKPLRYHVELQDQVLADQVSVNVYTGFDTSPLFLDTYTGLEGTFEVSRKYTHAPDVHYMNRFAEVEACLGVPAGSASCARVRLQPQTKEAEHISTEQSATRKTYSARPASEHWGRTALTVMRVEDGSQLTYEPINLVNVESLTFRFRALKSGTLEARLDQPGAAPMVTLNLDPESGEAVVPHQAVYLQGVPPDASGLGSLEEGAFENWHEVTVPITDPGGVHTLLLDFKSDESRTWLELDWVRFNGNGVVE